MDAATLRGIRKRLRPRLNEACRSGTMTCRSRSSQRCSTWHALRLLRQRQVNPFRAVSGRLSKSPESTYRGTMVTCAFQHSGCCLRCRAAVMPGIGPTQRNAMVHQKPVQRAKVVWDGPGLRSPQLPLPAQVVKMRAPPRLFLHAKSESLGRFRNLHHLARTNWLLCMKRERLSRIEAGSVRRPPIAPA